MSIITVNNVTKRFKDKVALDNISFSIEEGEFFGLIGPNGAGKSTLINIISNLMLPDNGTVEIGGYDLKKDSLKAKGLIALVPQELAIIDILTPFDNLEYFGALYGLGRKELLKRIDEVLEITGLSDSKKKKVKTLSGGMKRRLNIAVALLSNPKVLILDEPTVGVDPQSRNHILEFLKSLSQTNKTTILYTSHYMEEVESLCSKIFIMDEGKEIAFGSKEQLKSLVFSNTKILIESLNISGQLIFDLKNLSGVLHVDNQNDNTTVLTVNNNFLLSQALNLFESNNTSILKIKYEEPSIEDVFLNLTGKNLRD